MRDELYAQLPTHRHRVERATALVREALTRFARPGICLSGGKDSVCVLHLVRSVRPDAAVLFFDSGAEYPETIPFLLDLERREGFELTIYEPTRSLLDLYRAAGRLGYTGEANEGLVLTATDISDIVIRDPSRTACEDLRLDGLFLGLRAEESVGRRRLLAARGPLYWHHRDRVWHCNPIAWWTAADVWAYLHTHRLPIHPVYAKTRFASRDRIRVAPYAGLTGRSRGRLVWLRYYYPDLFNRFAAEFPEVRNYA